MPSECQQGHTNDSSREGHYGGLWELLKLLCSSGLPPPQEYFKQNEDVESVEGALNYHSQQEKSYKDRHYDRSHCAETRTILKIRRSPEVPSFQSCEDAPKGRHSWPCVPKIKTPRNTWDPWTKWDGTLGIPSKRT